MYCCLILRDVPENTELGIDMKFWRIGKNFRGIKEIPLGFHYVYFSAVNSDCKSGQRTGFGIWVSGPGFIVKQWVPEEEDFIDVNLSVDDIERHHTNFDEISRYLGPYPSECHRDWVSLTSLITPQTLDRLLPLCGRVYSCTQFLSESSTTQQRLTSKIAQPNEESREQDAQNPEELLPKLNVIPGTEIRFTDVPKTPRFPPHCSPTEITIYSIDRSYTLSTVLTSLNVHHTRMSNSSSQSDISSPDWMVALCTDERELLAELQFSYIVFLLNHVMDGWNQWRRIIQLVANCEEAVGLRPHFYMGLITVLYHQLFSASQSRHTGSDTIKTVDTSTAELVDLFFSEVTSPGPSSHLREPAFLPCVMRSLLRNILCARPIPHTPKGRSTTAVNVIHLETLQNRAEGFCYNLERRFRWGLKPEALRKEHEPTELLVEEIDWDGDEAPAIVNF